MIEDAMVGRFLDDIASSSPAPGGGSVAALSGALGVALTSMVCNLTVGRKKYADAEAEMRKVLSRAEALRATFIALADRDTEAFNKVMEAYSLPKDSDPHRALRDAAVAAATKEATLVPLEVMKHCIDGLALAGEAASLGNDKSISDAGVSALLLHAACEGAALNVRINLAALSDQEFVGWRSEEVESILRTSRSMRDDILAVVADKIEAA
jgi:formiminotetrahydrofolate cyclodeaminase